MGEDLHEAECDYDGNSGIWQKIGEVSKNSKNSESSLWMDKDSSFSSLLNSENMMQPH